MLWLFRLLKPCHIYWLYKHTHSLMFLELSTSRIPADVYWYSPFQGLFTLRKQNSVLEIVNILWTSQLLCMYAHSLVNCKQLMCGKFLNNSTQLQSKTGSQLLHIIPQLVTDYLMHVSSAQCICNLERDNCIWSHWKYVAMHTSNKCRQQTNSHEAAHAAIAMIYLA